MPTIRNILNIQGSKAQAAALLDFVSNQQFGWGSIDFNQVTPMPPWVYRLPTNLALLEKYGEENCARGWCLENWGTPQDALHPERSAKEYDGGTAIHFDTEDREVRELVRKLSLIFKDIHLDYLWASEDVGSNVGAAQYQDGEAIIEYIPTPGTRAAVEKALDILGGRAADYGLTFDPATGNYEYKGGTGHD